MPHFGRVLPLWLVLYTWRAECRGAWIHVLRPLVRALWVGRPTQAWGVAAQMSYIREARGVARACKGVLEYSRCHSLAP